MESIWEILVTFIGLMIYLVSQVVSDRKRQKPAEPMDYPEEDAATQESYANSWDHRSRAEAESWGVHTAEGERGATQSPAAYAWDEQKLEAGSGQQDVGSPIAAGGLDKAPGEVSGKELQQLAPLDGGDTLVARRQAAAAGPRKVPASGRWQLAFRDMELLAPPVSVRRQHGPF
jgi:hypothetical protein